MKERLKRNICGLDNYAIPSEVRDIFARRKVYIGDTLEYACQFWTKHLIGIPSSSHNIEEVCKVIDEFFTTKLLFWIEVLIIMESLDASVYALNDIQQWYASVSSKWSI